MFTNIGEIGNLGHKPRKIGIFYICSIGSFGKLDTKLVENTQKLLLLYQIWNNSVVYAKLVHFLFVQSLFAICNIIEVTDITHSLTFGAGRVVQGEKVGPHTTEPTQYNLYQFICLLFFRNLPMPNLNNSFELGSRASTCQLDRFCVRVVKGSKNSRFCLVGLQLPSNLLKPFHSCDTSGLIPLFN